MMVRRTDKLKHNTDEQWRRTDWRMGLHSGAANHIAVYVNLNRLEAAIWFNGRAWNGQEPGTDKLRDFLCGFKNEYKS